MGEKRESEGKGMVGVRVGWGERMEGKREGSVCLMREFKVFKLWCYIFRK